ncbi:hypothetical protein NPIL_556451, partial [Nephila pilipes]
NPNLSRHLTIRNCTGNGVRDLMLDQKYPKPPCELINTDQ